MSKVTRILLLIVLIAVLVLFSSCGGGGAGGGESLPGPQPPAATEPIASSGGIFVSSGPPFAAVFSWISGTPSPHAAYAVVVWDTTRPDDSTSGAVSFHGSGARYTYLASGTYVIEVKWYDGFGTLLRTEDFTLVLEDGGNAFAIQVEVP